MDPLSFFLPFKPSKIEGPVLKRHPKEGLPAFQQSWNWMVPEELGLCQNREAFKDGFLLVSRTKPPILAWHHLPKMPTPEFRHLQ